MSVFDTKPKASRRTHSVVGKVGIGKPVDEPLLVEDAKGHRLANKDITEAGVRGGVVLKQRHIDKLEKAGVKEVEVVYGGFPDQLKHFRLTRRSERFEGRYVPDGRLNEKLGLGQEPERVPIIFPVDDIERVCHRQMVNYDRQNQKMFCHSDGREYTRAVTEGGNYTGRYKHGTCIPTYGDERGDICPFRDYNSKMHDRSPCKFRGSLYFNVLSKDLDTIDFGSFFKFETTSIDTMEKILGALQNLREQYGQISWIPCQLELNYEEKAIPGGMTKALPIVNLSSPLSLMKEYKPVVEEMEELMDYFSASEIEIEDEIDEEGFSAEFRPDQRRETLKDRGDLTAKGSGGNPAPPSAVESGAPSGDGAAKEASLAADDTDAAVPYGEEFDQRLIALDAKAKQLDPDDYEAYMGSRDNVDPENINAFDERLSERMQDLSEEKKRKNFDDNSSPDEDFPDDA